MNVAISLKSVTFVNAVPCPWSFRRQVTRAFPLCKQTQAAVDSTSPSRPVHSMYEASSHPRILLAAKRKRRILGNTQYRYVFFIPEDGRLTFPPSPIQPATMTGNSVFLPYKATVGISSHGRRLRTARSPLPQALRIPFLGRFSETLVLLSLSCCRRTRFEEAFHAVFCWFPGIESPNRTKPQDIRVAEGRARPPRCAFLRLISTRSHVLRFSVKVDPLTLPRAYPRPCCRICPTSLLQVYKMPADRLPLTSTDAFRRRVLASERFLSAL